MSKLVEKKSKAEVRYANVAIEFQVWLSEHPDADNERKVKAFDAMCDSAILATMLKGQK